MVCELSLFRVRGESYLYNPLQIPWVAPIPLGVREGFPKVRSDLITELPLILQSE